jgi:hypothetical protein
MDNLKLIKKLVIPWEKKKQKEEEMELTSFEDQLPFLCKRKEICKYDMEPKGSGRQTYHFL